MKGKLAYPKAIWLSGWCSECDRGGRENWTWCEDNMGPCDECGARPRKYVLASERKAKVAEVEGKLRAIEQAGGK